MPRSATGAAARVGYVLGLPVWTDNDGSSHDDGASKVHARLNRIPLPELESKYRDCLDRSLVDEWDAIRSEGAQEAKEA